jgi:hypothetical protein
VVGRGVLSHLASALRPRPSSAASSTESSSPWAPADHRTTLETPVVLTEEQREYYLAHGYLNLPNAISDEWLARLRGACGTAHHHCCC